MKDYLIIVGPDAAESLVITSLFKRILHDGGRIHCLEELKGESILTYCEDCFVETIDKGTRCKYDVAVNFSPSDKATEIVNSVVAKTKLGYGKNETGITFYNEGADRHYRAKHIGIPTESNLFQLTFGLASKTWQGEGYWLQYFPRNRTRKSLAGVAVRDERMRQYLYENLQVDRTRLWQIPFRQNLLKQIDEANRCKNIITDDFTLFNIGLALRKNVEYLIQKRPNFKLELFGSGNIHLFNTKILESNLEHVRN